MAAAAAAPDRSRCIGTGLIGWGLAGTAFHGPLMCTLPKLFDLRKVFRVAVAEPDEVWGIPVVHDIAAILSDPAIELVVIASPDDTHFAYAKAALEAGKHCFIDKPFTETAAEAEELLTMAQSRGLICTAFHCRRHDAEFLSLSALLREATLGRLIEYEARFDRWRPVVVESWKERSRGALANLGPHVIDQAIFFFGVPSRVSADVAALRDGATTDDYWTMTLHYDTNGGGGVKVGAPLAFPPSHGLVPPPRRVFLKSSMLAADNTNRYTLHGTGGSFTKGGLDIQENSIRGLIAPSPLALIVGGPDARANSQPAPPGIAKKVWDALSSSEKPHVFPGLPGWAAEPRSQDGILTVPCAPGALERRSVQSPPGEYRGIYVDLHRAITENKQPEVTPFQICVLARIMEAARRSSDLGGVPVGL